MEKKNFNKPTVMYIDIKNEDVITTSGGTDINENGLMNDFETNNNFWGK